MRTVSDGTNIIIQILSEPVFKNVNLLMRINVDGAEGVRKPGGSVFSPGIFGAPHGSDRDKRTPQMRLDRLG